MKLSDTIIALHFHSGENNTEASLLSENLDRFSGRFKYFVRWIYNLGVKDPQAIKFRGNLMVFNPVIPDEIRDFPLAAKIFAASEAEEMACNSNAPLLIWLDPDNLFFHEPEELILKQHETIAISPVHLKNISSGFTQPIDPYWDLIYSSCGVSSDKLFAVTSLADQQEIRPHFNAGLIAVNPNRGILRKWKENFLAIWKDPQMESFYTKDSRYRLYIHQAVLAATILATCEQHEIKLLPPTYNFPLHVIEKIAPERLPKTLNQLVCVRYEDFHEINWLEILPSEEPLKSWLIETNKKLG